jgi:tRNA nucleotidyltransferase/poly(A) polymerase
LQPVRSLRARIRTLAKERKVVGLTRLASRMGFEAWIVGGALRDLVLGRDVTEVDIAVTGDAGEIARALESQGHGRAVLLSGERRPRVYRFAGRGRMVDIGELEGDSIETDLGRRDFTVNAMAFALDSGDLVDPFGGMADLVAGLLRMVAEKNLADDPLRPLRAARLIATHGLRPDPSTSAACRRTAPALGGVARERIQAELARLLDAREAAPALVWAAKTGLLGPAFDLSLPGREWSAVARALAAFDAGFTRRLPARSRRRLRLALLAARLSLSPDQAAGWLRRLRWGTEEAREVSRLLMLAAAVPDLRMDDEAWRWFLQAGDRAVDALRLAETLDPRSRSAVAKLSARIARRRPILDVRGGDVVEWLGIAPGPRVGKLLEAVRVESLAGRIRTRKEAREWLQSRPGRVPEALRPSPPKP